MKEFTVEADIEKLNDVIAVVESLLEENDCDIKTQMQITVAVEEIFVNIAYYAYGSKKGTATIRTDVSGDPKRFSISFLDSGTPYNPLKKEDPDVTLSAEDRQIGGLGIFMVKKSMDKVEYENKDGQNILTLYKNL